MKCLVVTKPLRSTYSHLSWSSETGLGLERYLLAVLLWRKLREKINSWVVGMILLCSTSIGGQKMWLWFDAFVLFSSSVSIQLCRETPQAHRDDFQVDYDAERIGLHLKRHNQNLPTFPWNGSQGKWAVLSLSETSTEFCCWLRKSRLKPRDLQRSNCFLLINNVQLFLTAPLHFWMMNSAEQVGIGIMESDSCVWLEPVLNSLTVSLQSI